MRRSQQMKQSFISVKKFVEEPYSKILGYPNATARQIRSRIRELERLGIKSISLTGPTKIGNVAVLGKGYVGIVVLAKKRNTQVALKIRRIDSQRDQMTREADLLKLANSMDVGPTMFDASKNFLVMEYLDGIKISHWISTLRGAGRARKTKDAVRKILNDCYRMDSGGFDHGELTNISKHVIIGNSKISLIDFESSSTKRRPSNVTSIAQAIFIGSEIAKNVQKIYKNPTKADIIRALQRYKREKTGESFENLLGVLKL